MFCFVLFVFGDFLWGLGKIIIIIIIIIIIK